LLEAEFASLVLLACTQLGAERLRLLRGADPSGDQKRCAHHQDCIPHSRRSDPKMV